MTLEQLLPWIKRLTNLDVARCEDGISTVRSWNLRHLDRELLHEPDLDTIIVAVLLAESVRDLSAQGVERTKLLKKLRDAKSSDQFWAVWAEIRCAAILIGHPEIEVQLEMEPDRKRGRHADYRLMYPDGTSVEVEFKALGLSAAEVAWHRQAAECFDSFLPPIGLTTLHGWLDQPIRVSDAKRARAWKGARVLSRRLKANGVPAWAGVRGLAIVGHETEENYLRRALSKIQEALDQLSTDKECWVAFWWGNGAPLQATQGLLNALNAPSNVAGLVFIGQAVAVPWSEISIFIINVDREADLNELHVESTVDDRLAGLVLDRFDSSSGLRPTILRAPGRNGLTLLRRDGRRRITPFNLLFDADPRSLAPPSRSPSPVQDTPLDA